MTIKPPPTPANASIPDAPQGNWVDRLAPEACRPFLRLARFDRPIGAWLLLFPCWWGQLLAEASLGHAAADASYLLLFLIGAFVMRGAGCTYNDIVDRDYDARVARTAARPIASGQVSLAEAQMFLGVLALIGLLVLIQFNVFTIVLGVASVLLIAVYPFAKRYTDWPQLVLGLTFKWGALVGWSAITGGLSTAPLTLYAGCVLWTVGYDTIYAHQDKDDDEAIGLRSTALTLGAATRPVVALFYAAAVVLWAVAGALAGAGLAFFLALALVGVQFVWQLATLRTEDAANCLKRFRSNQLVGWILCLGLVVDLSSRVRL
ncbi:MAG TPA: 4-hydroxybenzoate octaprenyltransferase [Hyphomicrobiaceae bacterium]|jgi:4-hydroxybenzoate polyprenyltransferase|nr:4-hydroxybenzoate octaprenyltransferase [Hyphomicrobiaceae bacterium]